MFEALDLFILDIFDRVFANLRMSFLGIGVLLVIKMFHQKGMKYPDMFSYCVYAP